MAGNSNLGSSTIMSTVSGTLLTVAVNIDSHDILKAAITAMIGATVSFCVSYFLKWLVRKLQK